MGKREQRKGKRIEYKVRNIFRKAGFKCYRVPSSGNSQGFKGDLVLEDKYIVEVKARRGGFKQLYSFLNTADILVVKADRKPALVVMQIEKFIELVGGKDGEKS